MLNKYGLAVIAFIYGVALYVSIQTASPYGMRNIWGLSFGVIAYVAMAWCLMLATRVRVLEILCGGLDRSYQVHKWLGVLAVTASVLHEQFHPRFKQWVTRTDIGHVAKEVGEWVYYPLLALVFISFFKILPLIKWELPYGFWRVTHRFMGVLFIGVVLHVMVIDMPFGFDTPLMLMLVVYAVLGCASVAYTQLRPASSRQVAYRVVSLKKDAEIMHCELIPIHAHQALRWKAGQFVFLSIPSIGLAEPHPFTIACAPNADGIMHFSIKHLGDWTRAIAQGLQVADVVMIEGAYGHFDYHRGGEHQLWLAGGIGITPFLAWLGQLESENMRSIHCVYCVRTQADIPAYMREQLNDATRTHQGFSYRIHASDVAGRIDADKLLISMPFALPQADMFFCGSHAMRHQIMTELKQKNALPKHCYHEVFEFR